jgi:predicted CXXCH cytochrome family protein
MRVRLTEIKLRPTGKKVRLDRDVEVESLFVGRGPDNDLSLKGLTISLHHATIRKSDGRVYIEAASGKEINVNGLVTTGERLGIGDRIRIGSWELRVLEPDTGMDIYLEYEEIDRGDTERAALDARTRLGIEVGAIARRPLSWGAVGLVFAGFLLIPLLWSPAQSPWSTGKVSRGHAYIESECQECHGGFFRSVQNTECTTCHYDIGRHAPADTEIGRLENANCADCHLEHRGREASLADRGSNFCSDCHSDMSKVVQTTELRKVSDFGTDHPAFKLAVVTDPDLEPVSTSVTEDLVEDSGLIFDHYMHVGSGITDADDEETFLNCGTCHQPSGDGHAMKPAVFEDHCQGCHPLDFDSTAPNDQAPHRDSGDIRTFIREFYWTRVLSGEVKDRRAPDQILRRRPGAELTPEESTLFRQWVDSKLIDTENRFYGRAGTCRTCHTVEPGAASDAGLGVRKVRIQTDWTPAVGFSHDSHTPFTCARCHPAAAVFDPEADLPRPDWSLENSIPYELIEETDDTPISEAAGDILIPPIETCRECHAGMNASGKGVVPSPCSMCHSFHVREHGAMN